jgi:hypothetical protein
MSFNKHFKYRLNLQALRVREGPVWILHVYKRGLILEAFDQYDKNNRKSYHIAVSGLISNKKMHLHAMPVHSWVRRHGIKQRLLFVAVGHEVQASRKLRIFPIQLTKIAHQSLYFFWVWGGS